MKKDKKNLFILIIVIICVIVLSYLLFFSGITNKLKASVNGLSASVNENVNQGDLPIINNVINSSGKFLSKYGTETHPNVFDSNSNLYTPLNNYKTYLKSTLGKTSVDTRLMTYKDFENLNCADHSCPSQMSWLFSVNYWTSSAYTDDSMDAAFSPSVSSLGVAPFDLPGYLGLRPVITISKSEL